MDAANAALPSAAARDLLERLIAFRTVSRDSNLGLIEWVRDHLAKLGASTRLTYDESGKKANLFATLGAGASPGLVLSGHTDVVPVDGQSWDTDPFTAVERDGKLYARGSADMKGFIAVALAHAPRFLEALEHRTHRSAAALRAELRRGSGLPRCAGSHSRLASSRHQAGRLRGG